MSVLVSVAPSPPSAHPEAGPVVLRAEGVSRSFGGGTLKTHALRSVSLELRAAEMTLLMGPSGSGKSTLLATLSGLLRPDTGSINILNQDFWRMKENEQESFRLSYLGFIFQGYNLFPALTAMQQLEIVLQWGQGLGRRSAGEQARAALSELGLKDKTHLRPHQLSGGEKQRVAVARALVKKPALVFADEPTAALDWEHGEHVVRLLRAAARERQASVLVVSHDPRLIPHADRVLHLQDGRLVAAPPTTNNKG